MSPDRVAGKRKQVRQAPKSKGKACKVTIEGLSCKLGVEGVG